MSGVKGCGRADKSHMDQNCAFDKHGCCLAIKDSTVLREVGLILIMISVHVLGTVGCKDGWMAFEILRRGRSAVPERGTLVDVSSALMADAFVDC